MQHHEYKSGAIHIAPYSVAAAGSYHHHVLRTGTTFLLDLHRRALADARLQLVESAFVAFLAGAWLGLRAVETDWGVDLSFSRATPYFALGAAALWLLGGGALMHFARSAHRDYVASLLGESGLLYLALEHEPAETLAALRRRESLSQLRGRTPLALSFSARMLALLASYPACASRLGFHPWPRLWRYLERGLVLLTVVVLAALTLKLMPAVQLALIGQFEYPPALRPLGASVLLLLLACFTMAHARKLGLWLALVEVLHGPVTRDRAVLTRQ